VREWLSGLVRVRVRLGEGKDEGVRVRVGWVVWVRVRV